MIQTNANPKLYIFISTNNKFEINVVLLVEDFQAVAEVQRSHVKSIGRTSTLYLRVLLFAQFLHWIFPRSTSGLCREGNVPLYELLKFYPYIGHPMSVSKTQAPERLKNKTGPMSWYQSMEFKFRIWKVRITKERLLQMWSLYDSA